MDTRFPQVATYDKTTVSRLVIGMPETAGNLQFARKWGYPTMQAFSTKMYTLLPLGGLTTTDLVLGSKPFVGDLRARVETIIEHDRPRGSNYDGLFVEGTRNYFQFQGREDFVPHDMFGVWTSIRRDIPRTTGLELPEPWRIYPSQRARGIFVCQAVEGKKLMTRLIVVRVMIYQDDTEGRRDLLTQQIWHFTSPPHDLDTPYLPINEEFDGHLMDNLRRATVGFQEHCTPSRVKFWETATADHASSFVSGETDWRKALDRVETTWDLLAVCQVLAPNTDFNGTPYKKARRMVDAYKREQNEARREFIDCLWPLIQPKLQASS